MSVSGVVVEVVVVVVCSGEVKARGVVVMVVVVVDLAVDLVHVPLRETDRARAVVQVVVAAMGELAEVVVVVGVVVGRSGVVLVVVVVRVVESVRRSGCAALCSPGPWQETQTTNPVGST